MKFFLLSLAVHGAVYANLIECQQTLFVLNQVLVLYDDSPTSTPNYDAIAEKFAEEFLQEPNSFFQLQYQIPIFIGLVLLFSILLFVYCRLYCNTKEEEEKEIQVYTLTTTNPGFIGSQESLPFEDMNIEDYVHFNKEKSKVLVEIEHFSDIRIPKRYEEHQQQSQNLPKYLQENLRVCCISENMYTSIYISDCVSI